jgi:hypothetical protein
MLVNALRLWLFHTLPNSLVRQSRFARSEETTVGSSPEEARTRVAAKFQQQQADQQAAVAKAQREAQARAVED